MKKLTGLNDPVLLIKPKQASPDEIPPTIKEVLLTEIGLENTLRGIEAVRLTKLGIAIMGADNEVELEDAEHALLKTVLRNPKQVRGIPIGYNSVIIGGVEIT